ncbi:MAG: hypothetical protein ACPGU0_06480, partial [Marinirhabdus sp.]
MRGFWAVILLLAVIVIVFSIPSVQTYVAGKVTKNLNEKYGTDINIHRLGLNWRGEVDVRGVLIKDHHKDTLVYARELQANILNIRNVMGGNLAFGSIRMDRALLNIKTHKGEKDDNLFIFSQKFNTEKSKPENVFLLFSNSVRLT